MLRDSTISQEEKFAGLTQRVYWGHSCWCCNETEMHYCHAHKCIWGFLSVWLIYWWFHVFLFGIGKYSIPAGAFGSNVNSLEVSSEPELFK